jgi:hypothetical protein
LVIQIHKQKLNRLQLFKHQWHFSYAATAYFADRVKIEFFRDHQITVRIYFHTYNRIPCWINRVREGFTVIWYWMKCDWSRIQLRAQTVIGQNGLNVILISSQSSVVFIYRISYTTFS